jgi:hypothetical protein
MPHLIELATTRDGTLALGELQPAALMEFEAPPRRRIAMRLLAKA